MDCSTPGLPVHHQLLELAQTYVHWVSGAIQTSHPLSSPSPPAFNLSQHQGLSDELALCTRWPKYWSFSFNINPSNDYSGLISFRSDWFDLLSVQGTLKSLLQHHSINSIQKHQLFGGQPSVWSSSHSWRWHLRKAMALTMWTFTGKAMSLLFNMLTRFVTAFLLRSKCLLSSWLQSPSAVTLEP